MMPKKYKQTTKLQVRIWGQTVGAIVLEDKRIVFAYDPKFKAKGIDLSPFKMPINGGQVRFEFDRLPEETYFGLPPMLADALPDSFGNALITAWLAHNGIPSMDITVIDRLAYMGKRGMGALEFHPPVEGKETNKPTALHLAELVESARRALRGTTATGELAEKALTNIIRVGTSAGGARAKAVIAWNPATEEVRAGQFDVPTGFEHWLLKFDGMDDKGDLSEGQEFGRIEYAYYLMACAAGINMTDCRLLHENGRAHFMTKRFDRDGNQKHHVQTLCAIDTIDFKKTGVHSYNQLFDVIVRLGLGYEAKEEAFRRMVFNVMAKNCDDHSKNISFLLPQEGRWRLAPAYDITFAYSSKSKWTYQQFMSVNGKFTGITRDDMLRVADQFGIGTGKKVLKQVEAAVMEWSSFAAQSGIRDATAAHIAAHHLLKKDSDTKGDQDLLLHSSGPER